MIEKKVWEKSDNLTSDQYLASFQTQPQNDQNSLSEKKTSNRFDIDSEMKNFVMVKSNDY